MSTEPPRNPFAAPDPDQPPPPPQQAEPPKQPPKAPKPTEPPSPEKLKEASVATFRFGAVMILTLLAAQLPLPYTVVAPVLGAVAVWFGVRAVIRSLAVSPRNLMTPMLTIGLLLTVMMSFSAVTKLALWPIEMERQQCLEHAITISAKAECEADYQKALKDRTDSARGESESTS